MGTQRNQTSGNVLLKSCGGRSSEAFRIDGVSNVCRLNAHDSGHGDYDTLEDALTSNPAILGPEIIRTDEFSDPRARQYFLRARYYDPATGRFTQLDTYAGQMSDPFSLHKYLYAIANPVTDFDPSGHFSLTDMLVTAGLNSTLAAIITNAAIGSVTNVAASFVITELQGKDYTLGAFGFDAVEGALLGAIGGGLGQVAKVLATGVGGSLLLRFAITFGKIGVEAAINTLAQVMEYRYKSSNPPSWPPADIVGKRFLANLALGSLFKGVGTLAEQATASAENQIAALKARFKLSGGSAEQAAQYFNEWGAGRFTNKELRAQLAYLEFLQPAIGFIFGDSARMSLINEFDKAFVYAFSSDQVEKPA
jgi:RHS repeat-associated protein